MMWLHRPVPVWKHSLEQFYCIALGNGGKGKRHGKITAEGVIVV